MSRTGRGSGLVSSGGRAPDKRPRVRAAAVSDGIGPISSRPGFAACGNRSLHIFHCSRASVTGYIEFSKYSTQPGLITKCSSKNDKMMCSSHKQRGSDSAGCLWAAAAACCCPGGALLSAALSASLSPQVHGRIGISL